MTQDCPWIQQLNRLRQNKYGSDEELAEALGIATRTLSDFLKRPDGGGREPPGSLKRLIDLLSGDVDSQVLSRTPRLNLVLIHGDFRVSGNQHPVDAVMAMHASSSHNDEFHYISLVPKRDAHFAIEALSKRRVQPHLLVDPPRNAGDQASDCFFSVMATWLAAHAFRRDLAHITVAASVERLWPMIKEIKELTEVGVTVIQEAGAPCDVKIRDYLERAGVALADPVGRNIGRVKVLKSDDGADRISYGFIELEPRSAHPTHSQLFFSYNHMKKDPETGDFERSISDLELDDLVSFNIGMNYKGPCAIDVALVERNQDIPTSETDLTEKDEPTPQPDEEQVDIVKAVKDAISVCADRDGWALMSRVGARLTVKHPYLSRQYKAQGMRKLTDVITSNPESFEQSGPNGEGSNFSALSVRVKPDR